MKDDELARMHELEDTYWWFVARRSLVLSLFRRFVTSRSRPLIVDIGCGTGATVSALSHLGRVVGLDASRLALKFCRQAGARELIRGDATKLPLASQCADVVTMLDVLEHLDDDGAAMAEVARILRPGGRAVFTVPAFPGFWSEHDEAIGHKMRYMRAPLRKLALGAGLEVVKLSYVITALFLPIYLFRLAQRAVRIARPEGPRATLIVLPGIVNRLITAVLWLESRVMLKTDLPFGVSLVMLAGKNAPGHAL
jgi:SAM-dependent methyltransferase